MRKIFWTLLLQSVCLFSAHSDDVTPQEARRKATDFVQLRAGRKATRIRGKTPARQAVELGYTAPENRFYVFNVGKSNGFVIVSGDDRTDDILGYADQGKFDYDEMPENMRSWLDGYARELRSLPRETAAPTAESGEKKTAVAPLVACKWNQNNPYNLDTPHHYPTGCVATAMAQIMYYWKFADMKQPIPAYTPSVGAQAELPAVAFQWDKMLPAYTYDSSEESKKAVAQLMRYCGQAVKMEYNEGGSGTWIKSDIFSRYFGYSQNSQLLVRRNYSNKEWENLIYNELKNRRPVLYVGGEVRLSHAFVCDGYKEDGLFHINWGWGGLGDGYFKLSLLSPYSHGTGGNDNLHGYSMKQRAIIGISKEQFETPRRNADLRCYSFTLTQEEYQRADSHQDFSDIYVTGWFVNNSTFECAFRYGLALYKDGQFQRIISETISPVVETDNPMNYGFKFSLGKDLANGAYTVKAVYRDTIRHEWKACTEAEMNFLNVTISDQRLTIKESPKDVKGITIDKVEVKGKQAVGSLMQLDLTITNNGKESATDFYLFINGERVAATTVYIDPGHQDHLQVMFVPKSQGKNKLRLTLDEYRVVPVHQTELEIAPAEHTQLAFYPSIDDLTNTNNRWVLHSTTLNMHLTAENKLDQPYADDIYFTLYKYENGRWVIVGSERRSIEVAGKTKKVFDFVYRDLEPRSSYFYRVRSMSDGVLREGVPSVSLYVSPTATGIVRTPQDTPTGNVTIYRIDGVSVCTVKAGDVNVVLKRLPKGIYIVNGKKTVH